MLGHQKGTGVNGSVSARFGIVAFISHRVTGRDTFVQEVRFWVRCLNTARPASAAFTVKRVVDSSGSGRARCSNATHSASRGPVVLAGTWCGASHRGLCRRDGENARVHDVTEELPYRWPL